MKDLQTVIDQAWEDRDSLGTDTKGEIRQAVDAAIAALDSGDERGLLCLEPGVGMGHDRSGDRGVRWPGARWHRVQRDHAGRGVIADPRHEPDPGEQEPAYGRRDRRSRGLAPALAGGRWSRTPFHHRASWNRSPGLT